MNPLDSFITLLHSRFGTLWQALSGAVVFWLLGLAVKHGLDIPDDVAAVLEEIMAGLGAFLSASAMQWYQATKNARLQKVLQSKGADIEVDSWIGENTINETRKLQLQP